ncbi:RNA-directed DNA polymerase, eukaryota [Tanacetum coccineum]
MSFRGSSVGFSGGIACIWDPNRFILDHVSKSDYFVALMGTWTSTSTKLLIISIYAPQELSEKRDLWEYLCILITRWDGETIIMGDFNEVRSHIDPSHGWICFYLVDKSLASKMRPILLRETSLDYGPSPFRFFHSWFSIEGFDSFVENAWKSLRVEEGKSSKEVLSNRTILLNDLQEINNQCASELAQKSKVRWSIEGDENSKYFHGVINKRRSQLAIRGILVDGDWISDPAVVKREFFKHFQNQFSPSQSSRVQFDFAFPTRLTSEQVADLDNEVSYNEVKAAVWDCGINKSPGPDGFTFEFFPKILDAKLVKDFRPISLIGSIYKIITKILANRLCLVLPHLISDVQSAFVSDRQILDGPFIINDIISWCKQNRFKGMLFKSHWCNWNQGLPNNARGSVLVNGSPTSEFQFFKGLKQGDPLSPFLFILVMETLHLSVSYGFVMGLVSTKVSPISNSLVISHLFYADVGFLGNGI